MSCAEDVAALVSELAAPEEKTSTVATEYASPEVELAALREQHMALKTKYSARCAAVTESAGDRRYNIERLLREDEEAQQLREQMDTVRPRLMKLEFDLCNETSFADPDGTKAVLGVTSGLKLPTAPASSVSTEEKIAALIDRYYSGGGKQRLIQQEVEKRRRLLVEASGEKHSGPWGHRRRLPREQEDELQRVVAAEFVMPRLGLVDAGGQCQHPAGERMLEHRHRHGFIAAVTTAFAEHYPLTLKPQHFWLLVSQAVATHVDLNAETVRKSWVAHESKKRLEVQCHEFTLGSKNNWASVVSGKPDSFAAQIATNTVEGVTEVLSPGFSNTTAAEDIAQKVVVMDICKNFFEYGCRTLCGFPQITLEGTIDDWELLRVGAERLLARCERGFAEKWASSLLPLLEKLLAARRGDEIDSLFWNSMCKLGGTHGSGASSWFNGWINIFFPYVNRRENCFCQPYSSQQRYVVPVSNEMRWHTGKLARGPDCAAFGSGMSQAPVMWEYYGENIGLEFNAGFTGATQDPETLEIMPHVSWFITYKPPEGPSEVDDY